MIAPRRDFLFALMSAPLALASGCASKNQLTATSVEAKPSFVNHNADGSALVTEGRTLIMSLTFPYAIENLSGGLPVQIQPESAGGEQLTESQPLYFYSHADGHKFLTILSAPLDAVEANYTLRLTGRRQQGGELNWNLPYLVRQGSYRETNLTLDKSFSEPSPEIVERMRKDFETMVEIYQRRTPQSWHEPFVQPVSGGDSDNFGDKRTVNRTKRYRHAGLDYHARLGTPVLAINDGTVALSTEQWVPGQTICLDHGGGVFSKYLHLSERHVMEGSRVRRGEVIGLSGNSGGQKTRPHLHLDLAVNGARVDPKFFMEMAGQLLNLEKEQQFG
jgi:murein DD-endopeptidase MepM/ murein hydrolase activator NlpD